MTPFSIRPIVAAMAVAAACLGSAFAQSSKYPSRPITLVVPYPAGGAVDAVARVIGEHMSGTLGEPLIIDNRKGAAGTIGAAIVAKAHPDGYTLLVGGAATHVFAPALYKNVQYDPVKSFAPIGQISAGPLVVTVGPKIHSQDLAGAIKELKAAGDRAQYCSNGAGTFPHLAAEMVKQANSLTMQHIPYNGGPACAIDLLNGEVWISINHIPVVQSFIKAGKLRALATTGRTRSIAFPDVPTLQELGMTGVEASAWFGLFAPANTPGPIIEKLSAALAAALKDPKVKSLFATQGDEPSFSTPAEFGAYIRDETATWTKVIRSAGLSLD